MIEHFDINSKRVVKKLDTPSLKIKFKMPSIEAEPSFPMDDTDLKKLIIRNPAYSINSKISKFPDLCFDFGVIPSDSVPSLIFTWDFLNVHRYVFSVNIFKKIALIFNWASFHLTNSSSHSHTLVKRMCYCMKFLALWLILVSF